MDALINVNGENVQTLQILFLTTLLTLLPSAVVMMTSFTRYIISFSFLRSAMGLQQNPPNMVLVGIALFLTHTSHILRRRLPRRNFCSGRRNP